MPRLTQALSRSTSFQRAAKQQILQAFRVVTLAATASSITPSPTLELHSTAARKCSKILMVVRLSTLEMKDMQQIRDTRVTTRTRRWQTTLWWMIRKAEKRKQEMMVDQEVLTWCKNSIISTITRRIMELASSQDSTKGLQDSRIVKAVVPNTSLISITQSTHNRSLPRMTKYTNMWTTASKSQVRSPWCRCRSPRDTITVNNLTATMETWDPIQFCHPLDLHLLSLLHLQQCLKTKTDLLLNPNCIHNFSRECQWAASSTRIIDSRGQIMKENRGEIQERLVARTLEPGPGSQGVVTPEPMTEIKESTWML